MCRRASLRFGLVAFRSWGRGLRRPLRVPFFCHVVSWLGCSELVVKWFIAPVRLDTFFLLVSTRVAL